MPGRRYNSLTKQNTPSAGTSTTPLDPQMPPPAMDSDRELTTHSTSHEISCNLPSTIEECERAPEFDESVLGSCNSHRLPPMILSLIVSVSQERLSGDIEVKGNNKEGWENNNDSYTKTTNGLKKPVKCQAGLRATFAKLQTFLKHALPAHVDIFLTHLYGLPTWSVHSSPPRKLSLGTTCTLRSPDNRYHKYRITGLAGLRNSRVVLSAKPKKGGKQAFIIVERTDFSPTSTTSRIKHKIYKLFRLRCGDINLSAEGTMRLEERDVEDVSTHTWSE
ncbi:hypothetical protein BC835DRAFT_1422379 [Cytidiella melzeri]|nr:hypothetical protein BC835DRAFT_1422379 [Cytidiella melzeri]